MDGEAREGGGGEGVREDGGGGEGGGAGGGGGEWMDLMQEPAQPPQQMELEVSVTLISPLKIRY